MISVLIILLAALILLAGIIICINPQIVFRRLKNNTDKLALHITAVLGRLVLGALLVAQAEVSRYPLAIEILGWLSILSALVFAVIGRTNFIRLIAWALSLSEPLGRTAGIFAVGFGAVLIHAFI